METRIACGHDPRRCCEDCCPAREGARDDQGGGCTACGSSLALPRVDEGVGREYAMQILAIMGEESRDQFDSDVLHGARALIAGEPLQRDVADRLRARIDELALGNR